MTRVEIQKSNGHSGAATREAEVEEGSRWAHPIQALKDILHWDALTRATRGGIPETGFAPDIEVCETEDAFLFRADVPGIAMKDLDVRITQNRLIVRGFRAAETVEKGETLYTQERFWGAFSRAFTLPEGVDADKVEATLSAGVLTITLPKKPEARPRRIPVK